MTLPESYLFWPVAVFTVVPALGVLLFRNPMYAAMSLVVAFFGVAGVYVLLAAQLLAALQVIVYAGAIMVLFLFVVMLLSLTEHELGAEKVRARSIVGALVAGAVGGIAGFVFAAIPNQQSMSPAIMSRGLGTVEQVGRLIYGPFVLPFEVTSILLLVAIVGAVVVAKSRI